LSVSAKTHLQIIEGEVLVADAFAQAVLERFWDPSDLGAVGNHLLNAFEIGMSK
jgi:hypothetical protein